MPAAGENEAVTDKSMRSLRGSSSGLNPRGWSLVRGLRDFFFSVRLNQDIAMNKTSCEKNHLENRP
jgi:hypothetical protein